MKNTRLGIIGGGQLGMLLVQAAVDFPVFVSVYDPNENCSAAPYTPSFTKGSFDDYDALMAFGKDCDAIIFELEKVNIKALKDLEAQGKTVVSSPATLEWIQDKLIQKEKFAEFGFPTSPFKSIAAEEVQNYDGPFPVVQKFRTGGYDGYGVQILKTAEDLKNTQKVDSIFEEMVDIDMEVSVMLARDTSGNVELYPAVEMVFDPVANLVDYLVSPARISDEHTKKLNEIAKEMAEKLEFIGVYAIEFFITKDQQIYVNEISPRPHNSGHHTVQCNVTSQYEQQVRLALGLPLGSAKMISPCVLVNLLADNSTGTTHYDGIEKAYEIPHIQYTLYGKQEVRPRRKMGHAVIVESDIDTALKRMETLKNTLTITSHE